MTAVVVRALGVVALLAASLVAAQGVTLPAAERVVLDNGTVLILSEKRDVPLIGLQAVLKGGAVADPRGKAGLAALFAAIIEKGAGERDAAEFAEAVDSVGGILKASAGLEGITISADFLARDADLMVELLADMLRRPVLDRREFGKLRDRGIDLIRAAKDADPGDLMPVYGSAFLFGEHVYATPVGGSEASLAAITHRDVVDFYRREIGADRLIIAVSGDFDSQSLKARLGEAFGDWRTAEATLADVPVASPVSGRRILLVDKPGSTQTYFWIGNVGVARGFEQRADLDLVNTIFGGRFTSMLNTALRVESGLTYGARSRLVRPSRPGSVAITSFTATATTVEAIDMALSLLGRLHDFGVTPDMLSSARNYVLGQFPTRLETAAQLAAQFAVLEAYGLDADYINAYGEAITAVDVESATRVIHSVYPTRDDLAFVLLGDAASIRDAAKRYGPVTEISITEPRFSPEPDASGD